MNRETDTIYTCVPASPGAVATASSILFSFSPDFHDSRCGVVGLRCCSPAGVKRGQAKWKAAHCWNDPRGAVAELRAGGCFLFQVCLCSPGGFELGIGADIGTCNSSLRDHCGTKHTTNKYNGGRYELSPYFRNRPSSLILAVGKLTKRIVVYIDISSALLVFLIPFECCLDLSRQGLVARPPSLADIP